MEIDRVLRPGGYWVLSGPPINWRARYTASDGTTKDPKKELSSLEDLARRLCWKKIKGKGPIAVWQKPNDHIECIEKKKDLKSPMFCNPDNDPDDGWYKKMDACITPLPQVNHVLEKWPKRLNSIPPNHDFGMKDLVNDNLLWKKRVYEYVKVVELLSNGGYRNVMDMNAGFGGFAASLSEYPVWVMNVVPHDSKLKTLSIIYERGLIGTYMNWFVFLDSIYRDRETDG